MTAASRHLILIDSSENRAALAQRLGMQGYQVELADDPGQGARMALERPPAAVVADLWMPSISGVQLCRLLKSEPRTAHVPVILRGPWGHRDRFWAERAGASAYVAKGRMGDLVRAIERAMERAPKESLRPPEGPPVLRADSEVRDRIAAQLDQALFDSVIAAEVRALASHGDFERLFDRFSQLLTQITSYRWIAMTTERPDRFAIHCHPGLKEKAEAEAKQAMRTASSNSVSLWIEDEDPYPEEEGPDAIVESVFFGNVVIGQLAVACRAPAHPGDRPLVQTIARELGGPLRIVTLVEESTRQARIDALTGLLNRRAFIPSLEQEAQRTNRYGTPASIALIDVDHFKHVNDRHGHGVGDQVLSAMGKLLSHTVRSCDVVARWGGEEFIALLPSTDREGGALAAERLRAAAAALSITTADGTKVPITISVGVATFRRNESTDSLVDRADRAMYQAKTAGRNRVEVAPEILAEEPTSAAEEASPLLQA